MSSDDCTFQRSPSHFDGLTWPDYLVIMIYFVFIIMVGVISSWRTQGNNTMEGYFLSFRNMRFIPVGASIFASNIGASHFIGLAGSGAASGIGVAMFDLTATYPALMLGWLFVPVYMASGVFTMPEYLRKRFGGQRIRVYMSMLSLLLYIFTKISADLFSGALFITYSTKLSSSEGDWVIYVVSLVLLMVAGVFAAFGGMTTVIWTDVIATVLMIIGACVLAGISFTSTGGYTCMIEQYFDSVAANQSTNNETGEPCGEVYPDAMHLFRSSDSDLPWTAATFGITISSIWYWCTDQVIVQRSLASKSTIHAKGATVLTGYLKLLPLWIMIFPGMAARVLFPDEVACANPDWCSEICGTESGCSNLAFIKLVTEEMPECVRGLMIAVLLSALLSSLSSTFNSASTLFTIDLYRRIRKGAKEAECVIAGKLFVVLLVLISTLWIPIITAYPGAELFNYIQSTTSYLAPPICAVFLLAVFWPRCNEPGAFWALTTGIAVGLTRLVLEVAYTFSIPACGRLFVDTPPDWWYKLIGDVHYLHFGLFLWLFSLVVAVTISLVTKPLPKDCLYRLTYWSRKSKAPRRDIDSMLLAEDVFLEGGEENGGGDIEANAGKRESDTAVGMRHRVGGDGGNANKKNKLNSRSTVLRRRFSRERATVKDAARFLYEDPAWRRFANINAAVVMTITAFIFGFYY